MQAAAGFFTSLFGGGAAATGAAATGAAATGAAVSSGISLSTILQGGATVLGMVNAINAGKADAEAYNLAAQDAEREKPLETLQGIQRRADIKRATMQQVGEQDVAFAASGVDLSFGTPAEARSQAFRQEDLGITTSNGTELTRQARLDERVANYKRMAKRAQSRGVMDALSIGFDGFSSIAGRG